MKFLIFNIIVFCSLGYLLTSQPNENFSEWAGNTKDKLSQISKKEVIETIKKATGEKNQIIEVNKSEDIKNKKSVNENSKNILDLESLKIEKLLGGGQTNTSYIIKVKNATPSAIEKVKQAGGEVILPIQKTEEKSQEKTENVENNDG